MAKKKVILLKVDRYDKDLLIDVIKSALDNYFYLEDVLRTRKVLLKPNLLIPVDPSYAITTHSVLIEAVGCIFKERGLDVYIADNPSIFNTSVSVERVYKETKVKQLAERHGFKLLHSTSSYVVEGIPFSTWACDFTVINLPKLKTHSITTITCAVKNLYGCISGAYKSRLHKMYPKTEDFIKVLLRVCKTIKPLINIVDAVVSLEGEGPATGGTPRHTGFIAIGDDALSVDYVVSEVIGLPKEKNPLISFAEKEGYFRAAEVEVSSEGKNFTIDGFRFPAKFSLNNIPSFVIKILGNFVKIYPKVKRKVCTGCGDCSKICPVGAITIIGRNASIDYSKCILCMCCFEVCRFRAIEVKESFLLKLKNLL